MATIGPKLQIDGYAEYKKNIDSLITQGKTLDSAMKLLESTWDKSTTAQEKAAGKAKILAQEIEAQKAKVAQIAEVVAKATEMYGADSEEVQKWTQAQNKAQAELNRMQHELDDCNSALNEQQEELDDQQEELKQSTKEQKEHGKASVEAGEKAKKFGAAVKAAAAVAAAAFAAATAAAVKLGKAVVTQYADYEQLVGGVETLYKSSSKKVQEYANNAYKTAGMSANEYMDTVTGFSASLISSLRGDTEKAAKYADMAITDMSDNANKMGSDMESIKNAYAGFAKGQYQLLDSLKLGYGGTKTEMERLVEDAEKLNGSFKASRNENGKLTLSYADIVDAIHIVQDEMGITGTTAREAEKTISGSIAATKSAVQNFVTGLGTADADVEKLADDVISSFENVVDNITPVIKNIANSIPRVATTVAHSITENKDKIIEAAKIVIDSAISVSQEILPAITELLDAVLDVVADRAPEIAEALLTMLGNAGASLIEAAYNIGHNIGYKIGKSIREGIFDAEETGEEEADQYYTADGRLVTGKTSGIHKRGEGIGNSEPVNSRDADAQANKDYRDGLLEVYNQTKDIRACVEAANEAIAELEQSYNDAYSAALTSIQGQYDLWDTIDDKAEDATMSISDLNAAMDSQIEYWTKYADNLNNLLDRNIDGLSDMVAAMDDGSAQSKAAIGALAEASDEEIMKMVTKWQELQDAQGRAAEANRDATFDMDDAVEKMAENTEAKLDEIGQSMDISDDARSAAKKTLNAFSDGLNDSVAVAVANAKTIGDQLSNGVSTGIESAAWKIAKAGKSAVNSALTSMKAVAQIASPSKITTGFGKFLGQGLINGMDSMTRRIAAAGSRMMGSALQNPSSFQLPDPAAYGGTTYNQQRSIAAGAVTVQVHAAPGQSAESIADAVMDKINRAINSESAVWA